MSFRANSGITLKTDVIGHGEQRVEYGGEVLDGGNAVPYIRTVDANTGEELDRYFLINDAFLQYDGTKLVSSVPLSVTYDGDIASSAALTFVNDTFSDVPTENDLSGGNKYISSNMYFDALGHRVGYDEFLIDSSTKWYDCLYRSFVLTRHFLDETSLNHGFYLRIGPDKTRTVSFTDAASWRNGLGGTNGIFPINIGGTGQSNHSSTSSVSTWFTAASGITVNSGTFTKWGKLACFVMSWQRTSAISVPASGNITNVTIGTFKSGYRPAIRCHPVSDGDNAGAAFYNIQTNGTFAVGAYDSTGAARTIAANAINVVYGTFILA